MSLVEIRAGRLVEAAAKLPTPTKEKPDSAIDAGIRKSGEAHAGDNSLVTVSDVTAARVEELLAPAPAPKETAKETVSAETKK
jgi:hypothetical protein